MPGKIHVRDHLTVEELYQRYRSAKDPVLRSHYHMLALLKEGRSAAKVAPLVGYSSRWVCEVVQRYNEGGPDALGDGRHQNPGREPILDEALCEALTTALHGPAPDGGLWTGPKIARWVQERTGREIPYQRGSEWARFLGFSLQRPRPRHAKADPAVQVAFQEDD